MKLFLQKNAKFSSAGGSAPKPQPPTAGGEPPDPQNSPPIANFWLRAWFEQRCYKMIRGVAKGALRVS